MSFQKCPVCCEPSIPHARPCPVCLDRKIIHSVTGLPPQEQKTVPVETPAQQDLKAEEIVKPLSALDEYSEDEILYWSTPYFDELQAKKAMRAQQIKDKEDIQ